MVKEGTGLEAWRLLDYSYDSAFKNLALEEALARCGRSENFRPTIRFWVNPESVILGRFQEAPAEVDISLCQRNGIQIARRFTGGGAVFHDEGTLNFTIVASPEFATSLTKLNEYSASITLDALRALGLKGRILTPNSIVVDGKKVSGAAGALGRKFALWHSSILVSTNIRLLEMVLAPSKNGNITRYVHSRWHPVTSLQNALGQPIGVDAVKPQLIKSVQKILRVELRGDGLREEEEELFGGLYSGKYSSPDWNKKGKCKENPEAA